MKILFLTNHLNIGGITTYVLTLASGLKKRGHKVYIASSGGELLSEFITTGVSFIPIPIRTKQEISPKILLSLIKIYPFMKKTDIDLIHSNSRTTQVLASILHRISGVPHVSTCHGFFKSRISRRLFPCWGQRTIAISEAVKQHLIKDFKVDENNITVIHSGIDLDRFRVQRFDSAQCPSAKCPEPVEGTTEDRERKKKDLGLHDGPVVGIVARLSEEKGHECLIRAMKEVVSIVASAQLLIVGEGRMRQRLESLVNNLELGEKVLFFPSDPRTQDILPVLDIFVLPSTKEGLGLSLMEAQGCGKAVIATNVGGISSLIKDGFNGILVEPDDPAALSKAILELLKDRDKREYLGSNARKFITDNFSSEKMVTETEREYFKCLEEES
jgi:glycosyltransferase involved in cell wall biosynthesis